MAFVKLGAIGQNRPIKRNENPPYSRYSGTDEFAASVGPSCLKLEDQSWTFRQISRNKLHRIYFINLIRLLTIVLQIYFLQVSPIRLQALLRRFTKKNRCLGKLFCYFLERVFVRRFPVKQMLIIGMCGYEKSDICMFPSF